MKSVKVAAVLAALSLSGMWAACGSDDAGSSGEVVAEADAGKARDEGKLVVAGSVFPPALMDGAKKHMQDEFGVELEFVPTTAPETLQRLNAEKLSKSKSLDVVLIGAQYGEVAKQEGLLDPTSFDVEDWAYESDPEEYWIGYAAAPYGVLVNRDVVGDTWPESWEQLVREVPDAKVAFDEPTRGSVGFTWALAARNGLFPIEDPEAALKELGGAGGFEFSASPQDSMAQVVHGRLGAFFPTGSQYMADLRKSKANIEFVNPGGQAFVVAHNAGIAKDAPHPHAAKLFLDYLLSHDFQSQLPTADLVPGESEAREQASYEFEMDDAITVEVKMSLDEQDSVPGSAGWFGRG